MISSSQSQHNKSYLQLIMPVQVTLMHEETYRTASLVLVVPEIWIQAKMEQRERENVTFSMTKGEYATLIFVK